VADERHLAHKEHSPWEEAAEEPEVGRRQLVSAKLTPSHGLNLGVFAVLPGGELLPHHHDPSTSSRCRRRLHLRHAHPGRRLEHSGGDGAEAGSCRPVASLGLTSSTFAGTSEAKMPGGRWAAKTAMIIIAATQMGACLLHDAAELGAGSATLAAFFGRLRSTRWSATSPCWTLPWRRAGRVLAGWSSAAGRLRVFGGQSWMIRMLNYWVG